MHPQIPDKLYFKIGEVAKLAEVPAHVLRYWESEFSGIKPKRANSQQRLYRKQDVELILTIKILLHEQGYTIAGARKLVEANQEQSIVCATDQQPQSGGMAHKLQAIKKDLQELQALLSQKKE